MGFKLLSWQFICSVATFFQMRCVITSARWQSSRFFTTRIKRDSKRNSDYRSWANSQSSVANLSLRYSDSCRQKPLHFHSFSFRIYETIHVNNVTEMARRDFLLPSPSFCFYYSVSCLLFFSFVRARDHHRT